MPVMNTKTNRSIENSLNAKRNIRNNFYDRLDRFLADDAVGKHTHMNQPTPLHTVNEFNQHKLRQHTDNNNGFDRVSDTISKQIPSRNCSAGYLSESNKGYLLLNGTNNHYQNVTDATVLSQDMQMRFMELRKHFANRRLQKKCSINDVWYFENYNAIKTQPTLSDTNSSFYTKSTSEYESSDNNGDVLNQLNRTNNSTHNSKVRSERARSKPESNQLVSRKRRCRSSSLATKVQFGGPKTEPFTNPVYTTPLALANDKRVSHRTNDRTKSVESNNNNINNELSMNALQRRLAYDPIASKNNAKAQRQAKDRRHMPENPIELQCSNQTSRNDLIVVKENSLLNLNKKSPHTQATLNQNNTISSLVDSKIEPFKRNINRKSQPTTPKPMSSNHQLSNSSSTSFDISKSSSMRRRMIKSEIVHKNPLRKVERALSEFENKPNSTNANATPTLQGTNHLSRHPMLRAKTEVPSHKNRATSNQIIVDSTKPYPDLAVESIKIKLERLTTHVLKLRKRVERDYAEFNSCSPGDDIYGDEAIGAVSDGKSTGMHPDVTSSLKSIRLLEANVQEIFDFLYPNEVDLWNPYVTTVDNPGSTFNR